MSKSRTLITFFPNIIPGSEEAISKSEEAWRNYHVPNFKYLSKQENISIPMVCNGTKPLFSKELLQNSKVHTIS